MKNKINRTVLLGILTVAACLVSFLSPEHSYAEKLGSIAFGGCTAIFVACLIDLIVSYRKGKEQAAE